MGIRTSDASIVEAARRVLESAKTISSQTEMGRQVLRALREADPGASVTPSRVRRVLALQPFVRLEMRTWKGPRDKILNRCPVCETRLDRVKNQTLFGGEVTLTLRCPACGYWTGKEKRVPALYIFHYEVSVGKAGGRRQQAL